MRISDWSSDVCSSDLVLYRFAPDRDAPRWRWVFWGAAIATAVWLLGSVAFSVYVSNFGSYGETYGSIGAVIVPMLWLSVTALAIILGAEVKVQLEAQTARYSTVGHPQHMGTRRAVTADYLGAHPCGRPQLYSTAGHLDATARGRT